MYDINNPEDLIGTYINSFQMAQFSTLRNVRIIRSGHLYTQDYKPDRFNIKIDDKYIVTEVYKG